MKRNNKINLIKLLIFLVLMIIFITATFYMGFKNLSNGGYLSALNGLLTALSISALVGAGYSALIMISDRHREHNMIIQTMLTREDSPGEISGKKSHDAIYKQAEAFRGDIITIEKALAT